MNTYQMPQRAYAELPIEHIDRPELDARIARDPEKLEELAQDILRRGIIYPLAVVRVGDRFEVVDGERRHLAALRAGLVTVPCLVYPTKELALEGVKYAANAYREDMSPAEEAVFFNELFTHECGHDLERVAAHVGKKLAYVDARISLLAGGEEVFEALRARRITIGVAQELNKVADEHYRRYYLECAIRDGATIAVVTGWIAQYQQLFGGPQPPAPPAPVLGPIVPQPSYDPHHCYICDKTDPRFIPEQVPIHTHCKIAILEPLLERARGEGS